MIYSGNKLKEIIFPIGGIGTGSIGLAGNGSLVDWEILNRPNKGSINDYSCFIVKAEFPDGKSVTKILQGDHIKDLIGQYTKVAYTGYGFGPSGATMCGLPHFKKVKFDGKFPIATLTFEDDGFPAKVILKAFNPFIPLDADNSSIPAAFFEIKIKSYQENVKYSVIFSVRNPFEKSINNKIDSAKYTAIKMVNYGKSTEDKEYGDMTIAADCNDGTYQEYWYRGAWVDRLTTFWREVTEGDLKNRHYDEAGEKDVCSIGVSAQIDKAQSRSFRFILSWNAPNNYNYWNPYKNDKGEDVLWKNYYSKLFSDSEQSAFYCLDNWNTLYRKTNRFCNTAAQGGRKMP